VLQAVGDQLDFTHDRIREVAYGRLLLPPRQLLHRAVSAALETASAAADAPPSHRRGEQLEQLAHHALRGELRDNAVRYLRQVGAEAAARSALAAAHTSFAQALDVLARLPETPANLEQGFEIRLELRPVLIQLGEYRQALERLREAEGLAERLDDDRRRGRVAAFLTNIHCRLDAPGEGLACGARALAIARRLGDLGLRIVATTYLAQAHYYRGEYARVVELAADNLAALPDAWVHEFFGGSQPPSVNDRFRLLVSLAHLGRFAEAASHQAEAIRLAEATRHPYAMALAYHAAGTLHLVQGDWTGAHALIERQIAALRAGNVAGELPTALAHATRALAHLGDRAAALERLRETEQLLEAQGTRGRVGNGWARYALGRAWLLLGRPDEAGRYARGAVESASGRIDFVPDALHLLGDVASHPDCFDADGAEGRYREALALAESRGMRPLIAHCHLGLGRLAARAGRPGRGAGPLERAAAMYADMGMGSWLEQARAERPAPR
jgi:tetratricopeptide (TPR) repeat protein